MEIALIILSLLNLVFLIVLFSSRQKQDQGVENVLLKTLGEHQDRQKYFQSQEFQALRDSLDQRIGDGLEKSRKTLSEVMERLVLVDSAQKQMEGLSENVIHLQNVLTDKKTRGIFGEVQLTHILSNVFGETKGKVYDLQYTLSNKRIADAVLKLPEPLGLLAVDAKFPLENYQRMVDQELEESLRATAVKEFSKNLKKHIDDISTKYIIPNETIEQAILFLPAEAIFSQIHAHHLDIVDYATKKRVWIASPTTFLAILTTVQAVLRNVERSEHMEEIRLEINKLEEDFGRFDERWDDLARHLQTVMKDVEKLNISQKKINDRFRKIVHLD